MASFFHDLWSSVFTPGTTPTLLLATNLSFFFLQLTLIALLFATYSIHLIILNVISAGLWAAINWFVKEVEAFKKEEEERKRAEARDKGEGEGKEGEKGDEKEKEEESKKEL